MSVIKFLKNIQIIYTLIDNPMMKGESKYVIIEQTSDFKYILNEHKKYKGSSLIRIGFRLKEK